MAVFWYTHLHRRLLALPLAAARAGESDNRLSLLAGPRLGTTGTRHHAACKKERSRGSCPALLSALPAPACRTQPHKGPPPVPKGSTSTKLLFSHCPHSREQPGAREDKEARRQERTWAACRPTLYCHPEREHPLLPQIPRHPLQQQGIPGRHTQLPEHHSVASLQQEQQPRAPAPPLASSLSACTACTACTACLGPACRSAQHCAPWPCPGATPFLDKPQTGMRHEAAPGAAPAVGSPASRPRSTNHQLVRPPACPPRARCRTCSRRWPPLAT